MTLLDRNRWDALEPLLDQALDLPGPERGLWLARLREAQPELAGELELLLSQDGAADQSGFLAGSPDGGLPGIVLGAYRLDRPLGQGGMGSVWLARRLDAPGEVAAIKLLNLSLVSQPGQERFRREGAVLARLSHPGIARLLDAGVGASGQPYLVLEYVDGLPIDQFVESQRLPLAERLRLLLQVIAAIGHAHGHRIIHRDLKPANILVTSEGTVKLLDFGIAKLLDGQSVGAATTLTLDGGQVLTLRYAAPEQLRGEPLTPATDVYALGVLLYLLVSGRFPTGGDEESPATVVAATLEAAPAPLGLGDLDLVLDRALRKDPKDRYRSAEALAEDIERFLLGAPVRARAASVVTRLKGLLGGDRS